MMMQKSMGLSVEQIDKISAVVLSKTGLYYPKSRWSDLEKAIKGAMDEFYCSNAEYDFSNRDAFIDRLIHASLLPCEEDVLIQHLTIGETFFFRDNNLFQVLENRILPWKIKHQKTFFRDKSPALNIWSAGCCSGEEPYSIAILLDRIIKKNSLYNAEIFATDINKKFLKKAETGIYTRWSFRNTPDDVIKQYFIEKEKNRFELCSDIRRKVVFKQLNLTSSPWVEPFNQPMKFDLILFRNVLMYFDTKTISKTISRLYNCLTDDGWLVVSPSEAAFVNHKGLSPVYFPGVIMYRKGEERKKIFPLKSSLPLKNARPLKPDFSLKRSTDKRLNKGSINLTQSVTEEDIDNFSEPVFDSKRLHYALDLYKAHKYKECEQYLIQRLDAINSSPGHVSSGSAVLNDLSSVPFVKNGQSLNVLLPKAMNLLVRVKANLGKLEEALDICIKTVHLEKLNPDHRYLLSTIYNGLNENENENENEKKALDQTLYLDPDYVLAHIQLGNIAAKQLKSDLSKRHMRLAKQILDSMNPEDVISGSDDLTAKEVLNLISV